MTGDVIEMKPEAAISLGWHLMQAGVAAMRDLARHAEGFSSRRKKGGTE
jgi:hypothetical protein